MRRRVRAPERGAEAASISGDTTTGSRRAGPAIPSWTWRRAGTAVADAVVYDWKPSGRRSATSDLGVAVRPDQRTAAPRPSASAAGDATVAAVVDAFLASATAGRTLNRSGRPYMPSALRDLRGILESHVVPQLGAMQLRDVRRHDVQALVDRLGSDGLSESRIRSVVSAVRALYGYAIERDIASSNPAEALVMPRVEARGSGRPESSPPLPPPPPSPPEDEARSAASIAGDGIAGLRGRLEDLWDQRPAWENQGAREDEPTREDEPAWQDEPTREDGTADRAPSRRRRRRDELQPIALMPERILSIAIRAVLVLLAVVAVVSFLESF